MNLFFFLAIIKGTNICDKCAPECETCTLAFNSQKCLRCANNYSLNTNGTVCLKCAANYAIDPVTSLCVVNCPAGYYNN